MRRQMHYEDDRGYTRPTLTHGLSLLSGMGLGALMMYLFDPEQGQERRRYVSERTGDAMHHTGENLGYAWETTREKAKNVGQSVALGASGLAAGAAAAGSAFKGKMGDWREGLAGRYEDTTHYAQDRARRTRDYFRGEEERHYGMSEAAVALCCMAAGAGVMFLMDPNRGNYRRKLIKDKSYSAARRSGEFLKDSGRYARDYAQGVAAETYRKFRSEQVSDQTLCARIRSEMGHHIQHASAVQVTARDGHVTLTGMLPQDEIDLVVSTVEGVKGVKSVDSRITVGEPSASPTTEMQSPRTGF